MNPHFVLWIRFIKLFSFSAVKSAFIIIIISFCFRFSLNTENEAAAAAPEPPQRMSRRQILTLISIASVNFSSMICYSILGPFFPNEVTQQHLVSR